MVDEWEEGMLENKSSWARGWGRTPLEDDLWVSAGGLEESNEESKWRETWRPNWKNTEEQLKEGEGELGKVELEVNTDLGLWALTCTESVC